VLVSIVPLWVDCDWVVEMEVTEVPEMRELGSLAEIDALGSREELLSADDADELGDACESLDGP